MTQKIEIDQHVKELAIAYAKGGAQAIEQIVHSNQSLFIQIVARIAEIEKGDEAERKEFMNEIDTLAM